MQTLPSAGFITLRSRVQISPLLPVFTTARGLIGFGPFLFLAIILAIIPAKRNIAASLRLVSKPLPDLRGDRLDELECVVVVPCNLLDLRLDLIPGERVVVVDHLLKNSRDQILERDRCGFRQ